MRRREIEPGTHCLPMRQKFHAKFPPIMMVCDVTACNYAYEHVSRKFSREEKTRLALLKLFIVARIS